MPTITNIDTAPGINVDIADGQLRVGVPAPGPKLTILGTTTSLALDENEPVQITNFTQAQILLRHVDGSPSELSLAYAEARAAGAQNVEVVKYATKSGEDPATYPAWKRFDDLETALGILKYHPLDRVVVKNAYLDEIGLTGTSPGGVSRSNGFGRQLGDFCTQVTKLGEPCFAFIDVKPIPALARSEAWAGAPTNVAGDLFDPVSLAMIQEWRDHLYAEVGTLDDHSSETELVGYLHGSSETAPGQISAGYTFWARDPAGAIYLDAKGNKVDGGARLRVVAAAVRAINDETQNLANKHAKQTEASYNTGAAVAVAAFSTNLLPHESLTNQAIPGLVPARRMPVSIAEDLLQLRMISLCDLNGKFAVLSGCTAAHNASVYTRSDYTRDTTVRIVDAAVEIVRAVGSPYIGKPISGPMLNALDFAITRGLEKMKPSGAIQDAQVVIQATAEGQAVGEINVYLTLTIGNELLKINTYVQLTKSQTITTQA